MKRILSAGEGYALFPTNINYRMPRYFPAWRAPLLFVLSFFMCLQALVAKGTDPASDAGRTVLLQQGSIVVDSIKPLTIGDRIPETLWNLPLKVVNHPEGKDTITLQEYRGKLIILDFWATWCSYCLLSLPELSTIQGLYSDQVEVLMVNTLSTRDSTSKIVDFFRNRTDLFPHAKIPSVVSDQVLKSYFPHQYIPHYIVIDKRGWVILLSTMKFSRGTIESLL